MADFDADYSELKGKFIDCHPECGMCCLCQPEILPNEMEFFETNHPYALVKAKYPDNHVALALKKGRGSCIFLNNRRCSIYKNRPAFCRQYPFYIHVGEKVSVELDLSCRGVWDGKDIDAENEAKKLVENARPDINPILKESKETYREFYNNCTLAGVIGEPTEIRSSVAVSLSKFTDLTQLSRILDLSESYEPFSLSEVKQDSLTDYAYLDEAARTAAMDSMATEDPLSMPVYCDKEWNWNIFMADGDNLEWAVLDDDGEIHHKAFASASNISLKPLEDGGRDILAQYVSLLNRRESFLGSVFNNVDAFGYEDHMSNAYYGTVAVSVLDLLWRASMLDHFMGTGTGAEGIKEAIIFYDMDRLDAPSIGSFV